jgi:hypothetical protein
MGALVNMCSSLIDDCGRSRPSSYYYTGVAGCIGDANAYDIKLLLLTPAAAHALVRRRPLIFVRVRSPRFVLLSGSARDARLFLFEQRVVIEVESPRMKTLLIEPLNSP